MGFPHSSAGERICLQCRRPRFNPESGRSSGEGIGYPLQYSWTSLVAQLVKKLPAMWETWVQSLGWEDPLEKGKATHSSILAWRIPWTVHGVAKSWTWLSDFHVHCIASKRNTCANTHTYRHTHTHTHTHTPSQVAIRSFSCLSQAANISLWMSLLHSIFQEYLHFQREK